LYFLHDYFILNIKRGKQLQDNFEDNFDDLRLDHSLWAIALFIRTPLLRLSGISNSPPPQRPPKVDQKWKNFYGRVHNEKEIPKDRIKISKEIYTR
jgi:predicted secreted Zn-dependent protease